MDSTQVSNIRLLLICASFPPYPGTGGRRWMKFAKYMIRSGVEIDVAGMLNDTGKVSPWKAEAEKLRLHYHPISAGPVRGKFVRWIDFHYKKYFTKKNPFDRSEDWIDHARPYITELIQKRGITHVIITSPPFALLDLLPKLRREFKELKLVADIRDIHEYYFKGLSQAKTDQLVMKLALNLRSANLVLTVNDHMTALYERLAKHDETSFKTLLNAFDPEDFAFSGDNLPQKESSRGITMVYTGNLIPECRIYVQCFIECVEYLKMHQPDLFANLRIKLFGNLDDVVAAELSRKGLKQCISFYGHISAEEARKEIRHSDFCLIFPADFYYKYSLESKFFEYTFFRKPIITFPEDGACSNIVKQNNLGVALPLVNAGPILAQYLNDYLRKENFYNFEFSIDEYGLKTTTGTLMKLLV